MQGDLSIDQPESSAWKDAWHTHREQQPTTPSTPSRWRSCGGGRSRRWTRRPRRCRRTSFSTLVNESNDFACVLTDAAGQSLAQNTESIPSFIGTLPVTVKEFIKQIGLDNMAPGDVLVTNTPWIATGHLNDITVAKPIFRNGRHRGVRRLHRARARHRRQGALGRAARGVRGGLPHPRDEAAQRGQARRDADQAAARRRAHARPDRGRPVGADHRARPAGAAASAS